MNNKIDHIDRLYPPPKGRGFTLDLVKKSKDEIYAAFFENSPQLTKVNKSLESINDQIQALKKESKAISNVSFYEQTSEAQKNSSNIPPP